MQSVITALTNQAQKLLKELQKTLVGDLESEMVGHAKVTVAAKTYVYF